MIRAASLPPGLLHAFVDAIESWAEVEHGLFMIHQHLSGATDIEQAWDVFSALPSFAAQRRETEKLIRERVGDPSDLEDLQAVMERVREIGETRNHIVHGTWRAVEVVSDSGQVGNEYLRVYENRGERERSSDRSEEEPKLGNTRFREPDLRAAQLETLAVAVELGRVMEKVVHARLRPL